MKAMEKNKKAVDMYGRLELKDKFIVAECMRIIKPVSYEDVNSAPSDIYHLSEHNLELIMMIMEILNTYGKLYNISIEDKEKLIEFSKLGNHFFRWG